MFSTFEATSGSALGLRAVQGPQLGVDVEQPVLALDQSCIGRVGDLGQSALLREQLAEIRSRQVVAEQVVPERCVDPVAGLAVEVDGPLETRTGRRRMIRPAQHCGSTRLCCRMRSERRTALDLRVGCDRHFQHLAGKRRSDGGFHLHRLEHGDGITGRDDVAGFDQRAHDQRRPVGPHDESVLAVDEVRTMSDLDTETGGGRRHHQLGGDGRRR